MVLEPCKRQNQAKRNRPHVDREVWGPVVPVTAEASGLDRRFARRKEAAPVPPRRPKPFFLPCGRSKEGWGAPLPLKERCGLQMDCSPCPVGELLGHIAKSWGKSTACANRAESEKGRSAAVAKRSFPHAHGQRLGSATPSAPPTCGSVRAALKGSTAPPLQPRTAIPYTLQSHSFGRPSFLSPHHITS